MEGHFIVGLGDGNMDSEIEPTPDALTEADAFLAQNPDPEIHGRLERSQALIEGFESPYGMELLSSVHWVSTHEDGVSSSHAAHQAIGQWNSRKKHLMQMAHVEAAWNRLKACGWVGNQTH